MTRKSEAQNLTLRSSTCVALLFSASLQLEVPLDPFVHASSAGISCILSRTMSDQPAPPQTRFSVDDQTLVYLRVLGARYPNIDATLAAIASLRAALTLPKGTVHVISDVHGEFKKLTHVINNASGSLRPLVEQTFGKRLTAGEKLDLLNMIYYPRETYPLLAERLPDAAARRNFLRRQTRLEIELLRRISRPYSLEAIERVFPPAPQDAFPRTALRRAARTLRRLHRRHARRVRRSRPGAYPSCVRWRASSATSFSPNSSSPAISATAARASTRSSTTSCASPTSPSSGATTT